MLRACVMCYACMALIEDVLLLVYQTIKRVCCQSFVITLPSKPIAAKKSDKVSKFATDLDSSETWSLNSSLQRLV